MKIKVIKDQEEENDKKWMTEEIRKELKEKKELNRKHKNENRERRKFSW